VRDGIQAGLLGEELADQPVGVLISPSLPGMVWHGKVKQNSQLFRNALVPGKLLAVISGDGVQPWLPWQEGMEGFFRQLGSVFTLQLPVPEVPEKPVDDGQQRPPVVLPL